ncbi:hypothetical protein MRX96_019657 [Rhipicephalus microplus]
MPTSVNARWNARRLFPWGLPTSEVVLDCVDALSRCLPARRSVLVSHRDSAEERHFRSVFFHGGSHELIHTGKRSSLAHVSTVSRKACVTWRAGMDWDWPASHASCHHFQTARHAS